MITKSLSSSWWAEYVRDKPAKWNVTDVILSFERCLTVNTHCCECPAGACLLPQTEHMLMTGKSTERPHSQSYRTICNIVIWGSTHLNHLPDFDPEFLLGYDVLTEMKFMPSADCSFAKSLVHKPKGTFALHATDNRMLLGYNKPYLKCTAKLTCQNSEWGLCRCLVLAQL